MQYILSHIINNQYISIAFEVIITVAVQEYWE
jgi:hypothetical protein